MAEVIPRRGWDRQTAAADIGARPRAMNEAGTEEDIGTNIEVGMVEGVGMAEEEEAAMAIEDKVEETREIVGSAIDMMIEGAVAGKIFFDELATEKCQNSSRAGSESVALSF